MFGHLRMFGCLLHVLMMFGCPLYIHNTRKTCFVRQRGCSYAPLHLDVPHMFGWPHMFGHPQHMLGCPLYVWISPICLDIPLCLDTSICLDAPCMFGWCLDTCCTYTTQRKHALADEGGVHMPPYICMTPYVWMATCMFGCPPYVWMHLVCFDGPICLDTTHRFGCFPVCLDAPCMFGHHPYVWMPLYVWMPPYVWTPSCMFGCPHMFGCLHMCING